MAVACSQLMLNDRDDVRATVQRALAHCRNPTHEDAQRAGAKCGGEGSLSPYPNPGSLYPGIRQFSPRWSKPGPRAGAPGHLFHLRRLAAKRRMVVACGDFVPDGHVARAASGAFGSDTDGIG